MSLRDCDIRLNINDFVSCFFVFTLILNVNDNQGVCCIG